MFTDCLMRHVTTRSQWNMAILHSWLRKKKKKPYVVKGLTAHPGQKLDNVWGAGKARRTPLQGVRLEGLAWCLSSEEHQRTYVSWTSSSSQRQWARLAIQERKFAKCCHNIQVGLSLNEHIWWASPPRLLSEDVSGQQSTSVTQFSCQRLTGSENIHTHLSPLCRMCCFTRAVPAPCLRIINESVRERGHQDFSHTYGSRKFFIRKFSLTLWRSHRDRHYIRKHASDSIFAHLIKSGGRARVASEHMVSSLKKT